MGFWPFGGGKVERVSRVVTVDLTDGRTVRGKLTIHFAAPRDKDDADAAADRVAGIAEGLMRERRDSTKVIEDEAKLSEELAARYPRGIGEARSVELAAIHVLGDVTLTDEVKRRSSSQSVRAVRPDSSSSIAPTPTPLPLPAPRLRRPSSSSSMRAIQTLVLPAGSPPGAIAQFIAPLVVETAMRLLIGTLRAHDLIALRHVAIDAGMAELMASQLRAIETAPGGSDAGREGEIARWQTALGEDAVSDLRRTVNAAALHAAATEIRNASVPESLLAEVQEALRTTAFQVDPPTVTDVDAFVDAEDETLVVKLAAQLLETLKGHDSSDGLCAALRPILVRARDDLRVAATVVRQAAPATKSEPSA